ncbi:hypothetical protein BEP19_03565 [Ammoniphilus oxalaticus]|uniref:WYL domain-containing protein n=1 Tax=Ammoniphilus oxalaticus TaxID=66863 RepID=A0A419SNY6_9BACL|nr:WYL domain-containing protein [Ammoniphilus oxalaticus]RKD26014.1 hypothetical protein BEP19_03565 [Ammoniphilus oxalaticus]
MIRELRRYLSTGQLCEIIYLDQTDRISQRQVKLMSIKGDQVTAYCYTRRAIRSFYIANVLAVGPVTFKKEA